MSKRPVAVVTGASRGIGRAIALELAVEGYHIAAVARTVKASEPGKGLADLREPIEACGVSFLPVGLDLSELESHGEAIERIVKHFGRIDLLVNNAGVAPIQRLDILQTTVESYDRVLSINLRGPFFFTQAVVGIMTGMAGKTEDYQPSIVFITSVSAEMSSTDRPEYCISKAGLSMAATVFADRLAELGIRVYEVRPGIVLTDMTAPVKERYDKMIAEGLIPLDRWGKPEDIAKAVAALARGDFGYSTGTVFELSGGMNIRHL